MRIVFFGTPDYVIPVLQKLHKTFNEKSKSPIVAVVTQPPKPRGRKQKLEYSPVDNWAHKKKIPIFYKPSDFISKNIQADVGVLASYGEIISKFVIGHLKFGILNIHPSLLPKFRGASPVQATIITGEEAGVTIIKLDEKMDHGPIISQFKEEAKNEDTTETLRRRLFEQSAEVLVALLPPYLKGKIKPREQNHKEATFTTLVKKADGFIPPEHLKPTLKGESFKGVWKIPFIKDYSLLPNAHCLDRFIRAMQPWPATWTYIQLGAKDKEKKTKRLKILKAHIESTENNMHSAKLVFDEVQLEGKNPVAWWQFIQGYPEAVFK